MNFGKKSVGSVARSRRVQVLCLIFAVAIALCLCGSSFSAPQEKSAANPGPPKLQLSACTGPGVIPEARCGTLEVFENREARSGRKISLKVAVLPAKSDKRESVPVFILAGGPGYGSTGFVGDARAATLFADFLAKRDLVFVDYRGTGESHPLPCDIYPPGAGAAAFFQDSQTLLAEKVPACRDELSKAADLTRYTTPNIADDLDDIRAALGYQQIALYGTSYGTRLALVYLRRHPSHTRALMLEGVDSPSAKIPLPASRGMQHALDRLFQDCAADPTCHTAFPDLRSEFDTLLRNLQKTPAKFQVANSSTGGSETVEMTRAMFLSRSMLLLYNPGLSRFLPYMIHQAAHGDYSDFASAVTLILSSNESGFSRGMYLSILCSEDIPRISPDELAQETSNTVAGTVFVDSTRAACQGWPRGKISAADVQPVDSTVPVLMYSGDIDPVTPPWIANEAASHMPNSLNVVNPNGGHGSKTRACQLPLMEKFLEAGSAKSLDTSCITNARRPAFVIDGKEVSAMFAGRARGN